MTDWANKSILIIDDDKITTSLFSIYIKQTNINISVCHNSVAALGLIKTNTYDVIVLDVVLNEITTGIDIYNTIRLMGIKTPVMFCTAYSDKLMDIMFPELVIIKPVSQCTFINKINQLLV